MRNLKKRLEELKSKNPYLSTYILLAEAIAGTKYKGSTYSLIKKLVDPEDYSEKELAKLARHLFSLSQFDTKHHTKSEAILPSKRPKSKS